MCNTVESQTSSCSRSVRAKRRCTRTHEKPQGPALAALMCRLDMQLQYKQPPFFLDHA